MSAPVDAPAAGAPRPLGRAVALGLLLALELALLAVLYQVMLSFECAAVADATACGLLRSLVARGMTLLAAMVLYFRARPAALSGLVACARPLPAALPWLALHGAGVVLLLLPLLGGGAIDFRAALLPWLAGGAAATAGALFFLAPPGAWLGWLGAERWVPLPVVIGAMLVPELAERLLPLWDVAWLTRATFLAVQRTLELAGTAPFVEPEAYLIGVGDYLVHIAHYCSGVEGFALVTAFAAIYALLFRSRLRQGRFWLLVLPAALVLSWLLNVARLAALVAIGGFLSPELATGGFHSYAGWMFFTLLALGMMAALPALPFLWRGAADGQVAAPSAAGDVAAARILPFIAFMLASVAAAALSPVPDLAYPVKVLAMAAALAACAAGWRGLALTRDPVAALAGLGVGVLWLATLPGGGAGDVALAEALAGLAPLALAAWVAFRLVGTVLLVPVVEELFFRGYLLARLDGPSPARRAAAVALSSAAFALLHGRWLAAGIAGVVFGLVMLRRGRLADAILAHALANLVIAIWALARGDWAAI